MRRLFKILLRLACYVIAGLCLFWLCGLVAYRWIDPPATPLMGLRAMEGGVSIRYRPMPLQRIDRALQLAVVASEDARFCLHSGIDLGAVRDAIEDYQESGRLRGASTITMQVARNLFLWTGGGFIRKGLEAPLALAIDALWPKRRILELYLNIAEWGPGVFGAEAAARMHFDRAAAELSPGQAARLAAVLPSPLRWSPSQSGEYVQRRAGIIQARSGQLAPEQTACFR